MRLHSDGNFDLIINDDTPDKPYFKTTRKEYFEQKKRERKKLIKHKPKNILVCLNPKLRHLLEVRKWRRENPEKDKISNRKHQAKRRGLGFIPLNKPFVGSQPHHIDKEHIIYIPKELHRSIYHNIWTGKGMELINEQAMKFLLIKNER